MNKLERIIIPVKGSIAMLPNGTMRATSHGLNVILTQESNLNLEEGFKRGFGYTEYALNFLTGIIHPNAEMRLYQAEVDIKGNMIYKPHIYRALDEATVSPEEKIKVIEPSMEISQRENARILLDSINWYYKT